MFLCISELTGLSLRELAVIFGVQRDRSRIISQVIGRTRVALSKCHLVQSHIGFGHISVDQVIQHHTTTFAREFFGRDPVTGKEHLVFLDGMTYAFQTFFENMS